MSAAEFYTFDLDRYLSKKRATREEKLEAEAEAIEQNIVLLQSHLRGLFVRQNQNSTITLGPPHDERRRHRLLSAVARRPAQKSKSDSVLRFAAENHHQFHDNENQRSELSAFTRDDRKRSAYGVESQSGTGATSQETPRISQKYDVSSNDSSNPFKGVSNISETRFHPDTLVKALEVVAKDRFKYEVTEPAPWWIESPQSGRECGLCEVCRCIDFDTLLHKTDTYMYDPPIPLGPLQLIRNKTDCSFCRLIPHVAASGTQQSIDAYYQSLGNTEHVQCFLVGDPDWNLYETRIRQICVRFEAQLPHSNERHGITGMIQQILADGNRPPEQRFNDVRVVHHQADIDLISSWITNCKDKHSSSEIISNGGDPEYHLEDLADIHSHYALFIESCNPVSLSNNKTPFTLVDVNEECLVDAEPNVQYVALSYVWGGPQPFQNTLKSRSALYSRHSISKKDESIPLTIRDSMALTASLGLKFIWIDALCICQDDYEGKMKQIENMGNIYSGAYLTLVAAAGSSCHAGLPGVRPASRGSQQHAETVQGMVLCNELPHLRQSLDAMKWNQRGWTYQENELSKRYLIFCENQVYFRCNQSIYKEDSGLRNVSYNKERALRIRGENHPVWNGYRRAVEGFSCRQLSFEADMVNAFLGVASIFRNAFKGEFIYGLPETELDIALLWQPQSSIRRRIDEAGKPLFPSWSWAGWVGEVRYKWSKHLLDDQCRVEWQCVDGETGSVCFCTSDDIRAPKDGSLSQWENKWEYVLPIGDTGTPYCFQPEKEELWCLRPVAEPEERRYRILTQPQSHFLRFMAYTANFRISPFHESRPRGSITTCSQDDHKLCPYPILDIDGFSAGIIYLPEHERVSVAGAKEDFELVCLSRRRSDTRNELYNSDQCEIPTPEADFLDSPSRVMLYPPKNNGHSMTCCFDPRRYNMYKTWPLYNVMLIRWTGEIAERVAL